MGLLLSAFSWSYALCRSRSAGWSTASGAPAARDRPDRGRSRKRRAVSCRPLAGSSSRASCSASARRRSSRRPRGGEQLVSAARTRHADRHFNAASPLGTALAPLLLSILVASLDWRWAFIATAQAGHLAVVWFALYRDPVRATDCHRAQLLDADAQSTVAAPKLTFAEWRGLYSHGTAGGC